MWDMGEIAMPGGWALSTAWLPMCGQTWARAAASFIGMWAVMTMAMMLPSAAPMLWRVRARLVAFAATGYFLVWMAVGVIVFGAGAALAQLTTQVAAAARAVPLATGWVVLLAGAFQLTPWKAHSLRCCRPAWGSASAPPAVAAGALRYGVWLGLHCTRACAGLTFILLVVGVMEMRAMAAVAAAITIERLAPAGERAARATGMLAILAGACLVVRAVLLE
jgi:predicted metal-binding membrane protein